MKAFYESGPFVPVLLGVFWVTGCVVFCVWNHRVHRVGGAGREARRRHLRRAALDSTPQSVIDAEFDSLATAHRDLMDGEIAETFERNCREAEHFDGLTHYEGGDGV